MDDPQIMRAFGQLVNAMSGGGDRGNTFPQSDADDFGYGARFIPGEVTLLRREGQQVIFVQNCGSCCWYWLLPDESRIYHFERYVYLKIARANGVSGENPIAGACPSCGNTHTSGGRVSAKGEDLDD